MLFSCFEFQSTYFSSQNPLYAAALQTSLSSPNEVDQESLAATESIAAELATDHTEVTQQIQAGLFINVFTVIVQEIV